MVIRKVSKKRALQIKEYVVLRKEFLEANPKCEIYPNLDATDVHHTFCGANRNKYFLDVSTWMAVSRLGHYEIHNNVAWAKEKGYLK